MKNYRRIIVTMFVALLVPTPVMACADGHDVSASITHYVEIGEALSNDSVEGVQAHAQGMLEIMESHAETTSKEHMESMSGSHNEMEDMSASHDEMEASLSALVKEDLTLDGAREAYMGLSKNFIAAAQMMYQKSEDDPEWAVMNCPMVKADWIQVDGKVSNPYYGSKMLRCGKKVAALEMADTEMHESSEGIEQHGHHGDGH